MLRNVPSTYDFTQLSDAWVRKEIVSLGLSQTRPTRQISIPLEMVSAPKKAIATTHSFESLHRLQELRERVSTFAVYVPKSYASKTVDAMR